ncbi:MAG: type II toxin-antitoxin system VapC family toxin [Dehalococcoidia bacterium]
MSLPLYADTSALVPYYVPEEFSDLIQSILQAQPGPTISDVVELEFYSALSIKLRTGERNHSAMVQITALFHRHIEAGLFKRIALHAGHYRVAREFIGRFDLPLKAPDSLHLAICATEGLRLLTLDEQLARNATALGIEVESIQR